MICPRLYGPGWVAERRQLWLLERSSTPGLERGRPCWSDSQSEGVWVSHGHGVGLGGCLSDFPLWLKLTPPAVFLKCV